MEFAPVGEDCRGVLHQSRDAGGEHFCDLAARPEEAARVTPWGRRPFVYPQPLSNWGSPAPAPAGTPPQHSIRIADNVANRLL